jgi:hypothetical protein
MVRIALGVFAPFAPAGALLLAVTGASWIFTLASCRSLAANSGQHARAEAGRRGWDVS